jgi:hypothetical protein
LACFCISSLTSSIILLSLETEVSSPSLFIRSSVADLLSEESQCPVFYYFLCFYFEICSSVND